MRDNYSGFSSILADTTRQWKLVLLIPLFCLIAVAVFLLAVPPAAGFEYSIYEAYPLVFWILAGFIFLFPFIYLYTSHVNCTKIPFSKKSIYGLLAAAVINLVLLLHIPKARGYLMCCGGDALTHIGYCVDILNSGHMLTQNHYPLSHVHLSITSMLTGLTPQDISLSMVSVVIVLFILGIICLSRVLRFTTLQTLSITAFSIIPIQGYLLTQESIMPSTNGWAFIPLFLMVICYLIFNKINLMPYLICGIILCAAMCFAHPEAVLFPTIMVVVILGFCLVWSLIHRENRKYIRKYVLIISFIVIFVVGFLIFFLNTSAGAGQLSKYISIIESIISPAASVATTPVSISELGTTQNLPSLCASFLDGNVSLPFFILSFWERLVDYMEYWPLLILSALCLLTTVWYLVSKKFRSLDLRYIIIMALFYIFVVISIVLMAVYPEMWSVQRIYKYSVIFGIFILGILFSDFICSTDKSKLRRILSIMSVIAIIFMLIFSMVSFYRSPGIGQSNYQITNEDVEAMHLIYEYRNTAYLIVESGNQHQFRYNSYIYGMVYGEKQDKNIRGVGAYTMFPPSNFGYNQHDTLGQSYNNPTYYIKSPPYGEYNRWLLNKPEYWPLGGKDDFGTSPSSWTHLSYDSSVDKIQDGNAIEAYLIHPNSGT